MGVSSRLLAKPPRVPSPCLTGCKQLPTACLLDKIMAAAGPAVLGSVGRFPPAVQSEISSWLCADRGDVQTPAWGQPAEET